MEVYKTNTLITVTRHLTEITKERKAFLQLTILGDTVHHRKKGTTAAMVGGEGLLFTLSPQLGHRQRRMLASLVRPLCYSACDSSL